ncbi:MAG: polyprenyl synthetase family protein [Proteobacteria bacterium]|nr:polyprenyl synthetase family protein [Pseudomonadota bacterium]
MESSVRIEQALSAAIDLAKQPGCPPRLYEAMRHAVFPAGARLRPRLCLAVALSCGETDLRIPMTAAVAIELLHCASLVHDDLPCFDDADTRRGRPSVHRAFGEALAVLTGDALIVQAFQVLARMPPTARLGSVLASVSAGVGTPWGIVAGQAWECEPTVDVAQYHRLKTGALFAAATMAGAAAAGVDPGPWRALGDGIGEAFQVADDIRDATSTAEEMGKPAGRDLALDRPSVVRELGLEGAIGRLDRLIGEVGETIPTCPGAAELHNLIRVEARRLLPAKLAQRAA